MRVVALLDQAGYQLALLATELTQDVVVLGVAQPLKDDLTRGARRDPPETGGRVIVLTHCYAVVVDFRRPDGDVAGPTVQLRPGNILCTGGLVIRNQQRLLDRWDQQVKGNFTLAFK